MDVDQGPSTNCSECSPSEPKSSAVRSHGTGCRFRHEAPSPTLSNVAGVGLIENAERPCFVRRESAHEGMPHRLQARNHPQNVLAATAIIRGLPQCAGLPNCNPARMGHTGDCPLFVGSHSLLAAGWNHSTKVRFRPFRDGRAFAALQNCSPATTNHPAHLTDLAILQNCNPAGWQGCRFAGLPLGTPAHSQGCRLAFWQLGRVARSQTGSFAYWQLCKSAKWQACTTFC